MRTSQSLSVVALTAAVMLLAIPVQPVRAGEPGQVRSASAEARTASSANRASMKSRQRRWMDRQYEIAAARFPSFCSKWERLLQKRQVNNSSHIHWSREKGWQTGTYTAYGRIKQCTCKQSRQGFAIGKLTYDQLTYRVAGKTREQARHAKPQVAEIIKTTEVFRWDHGKWFDF